MRFIDKICNLLAILAGVYLVVIMFGIVIQATLRSFNFSGSSHFSAGEIIGVSIEPQTGPGDVNVTCLWEFDFTGVL